MNRQALKNILIVRTEKQYCTVTKPLVEGMYQVKDTQGRILDVDSRSVWQVGAGVVVKDGEIIGQSSNIITQKTYQV